MPQGACSTGAACSSSFLVLCAACRRSAHNLPLLSKYALLHARLHVRAHAARAHALPRAFAAARRSPLAALPRRHGAWFPSLLSLQPPPTSQSRVHHHPHAPPTLPTFTPHRSCTKPRSRRRRTIFPSDTSTRRRASRSHAPTTRISPMTPSHTTMPRLRSERRTPGGAPATSRWTTFTTRP